MPLKSLGEKLGMWGEGAGIVEPCVQTAQYSSWSFISVSNDVTGSLDRCAVSLSRAGMGRRVV